MAITKKPNSIQPAYNPVTFVTDSEQSLTATINYPGTGTITLTSVPIRGSVKFNFQSVVKSLFTNEVTQRAVTQLDYKLIASIQVDSEDYYFLRAVRQKFESLNLLELIPEEINYTILKANEAEIEDPGETIDWDDRLMANNYWFTNICSNSTNNGNGYGPYTIQRYGFNFNLLKRKSNNYGTEDIEGNDTEMEKRYPQMLQNSNSLQQMIDDRLKFLGYPTKLSQTDSVNNIAENFLISDSLVIILYGVKAINANGVDITANLGGNTRLSMEHRRNGATRTQSDSSNYASSTIIQNSEGAYNLQLGWISSSANENTNLSKTNINFYRARSAGVITELSQDNFMSFTYNGNNGFDGDGFAMYIYISAQTTYPVTISFDSYGVYIVPSAYIQPSLNAGNGKIIQEWMENYNPTLEELGSENAGYRINYAINKYEGFPLKVAFLKTPAATVTISDGSATEVITDTVPPLFVLDIPADRTEDYTLSQGKLILYNTCAPANPFYVQFINKNGGYSQIMFERWTEEQIQTSNVKVLQRAIVDWDTDIEKSTEVYDLDAERRYIVGKGMLTAEDVEALIDLQNSCLIEWYDQTVGHWKRLNQVALTNVIHRDSKWHEVTFEFVEEVLTQF